MKKKTFQMSQHWYVRDCHCVVSENIHTPTTEGISVRTPSSPDFPFFEVRYNPPIPLDFPQFDKHSPTLLENFVQEGKVLKMKQMIQI